MERNLREDNTKFEIINRLISKASDKSNVNEKDLYYKNQIPKVGKFKLEDCIDALLDENKDQSKAKSDDVEIPLLRTFETVDFDALTKGFEPEEVKEGKLVLYITENQLLQLLKQRAIIVPNKRNLTDISKKTFSLVDEKIGSRLGSKTPIREVELVVNQDKDGLSGSNSRLGLHSGSQSGRDGINASDGKSEAYSGNQTGKDGLSRSNGISGSHSIRQSGRDGLSGSDGRSGAYSGSQSSRDVLVGYDDRSDSISGNQSGGDGLIASESRSGSYSGSQSGRNGYSVSDGRSGSNTGSQSGRDGINQSDSKSGAYSAHQSGRDGLIASDSRSGSHSANQSGRDGINASESRSGSYSGSQSGRNGFSVSDDRSGSNSGSQSASDGINPSDSRSVTQTARQSGRDGISASDGELGSHSGSQSGRDGLISTNSRSGSYSARQSGKDGSNVSNDRSGSNTGSQLGIDGINQSGSRSGSYSANLSGRDGLIASESRPDSHSANQSGKNSLIASDGSSGAYSGKQSGRDGLIGSDNRSGSNTGSQSGIDSINPSVLISGAHSTSQSGRDVLIVSNSRSGSQSANQSGRNSLIASDGSSGDYSGGHSGKDRLSRSNGVSGSHSLSKSDGDGFIAFDSGKQSGRDGLIGSDGRSGSFSGSQSGRNGLSVSDGRSGSNTGSQLGRDSADSKSHHNDNVSKILEDMVSLLKFPESINNNSGRQSKAGSALGTDYFSAKTISNLANISEKDDPNTIRRDLNSATSKELINGFNGTSLTHTGSLKPLSNFGSDSMSEKTGQELGNKIRINKFPANVDNNRGSNLGGNYFYAKSDGRPDSQYGLDSLNGVYSDRDGRSDGRPDGGQFDKEFFSSGKGGNLNKSGSNFGDLTSKKNENRPVSGDGRESFDRNLNGLPGSGSHYGSDRFSDKSEARSGSDSGRHSDSNRPSSNIGSDSLSIKGDNSQYGKDYQLPRSSDSSNKPGSTFGSDSLYGRVDINQKSPYGRDGHTIGIIEQDKFGSSNLSGSQHGMHKNGPGLFNENDGQNGRQAISGHKSSIGADGSSIGSSGNRSGIDGQYGSSLDSNRAGSKSGQIGLSGLNSRSGRDSDARGSNDLNRPGTNYGSDNISNRGDGRSGSQGGSLSGIRDQSGSIRPGSNFGSDFLSGQTGGNNFGTVSSNGLNGNFNGSLNGRPGSQFGNVGFTDKNGDNNRQGLSSRGSSSFGNGDQRSGSQSGKDSFTGATRDLNSAGSNLGFNNSSLGNGNLSGKVEDFLRPISKGQGKDSTGRPNSIYSDKFDDLLRQRQSSNVDNYQTTSDRSRSANPQNNLNQSLNNTKPRTSSTYSKDNLNLYPDNKKRGPLDQSFDGRTNFFHSSSSGPGSNQPSLESEAINALDKFANRLTSSLKDNKIDWPSIKNAYSNPEEKDKANLMKKYVSSLLGDDLPKFSKTASLDDDDNLKAIDDFFDLVLNKKKRQVPDKSLKILDNFIDHVLTSRRSSLENKDGGKKVQELPDRESLDLINDLIRRLKDLLNIKKSDQGVASNNLDEKTGHKIIIKTTRKLPSKVISSSTSNVADCKQVVKKKITYSYLDDKYDSAPRVYELADNNSINQKNVSHANDLFNVKNSMNYSVKPFDPLIADGIGKPSVEQINKYLSVVNTGLKNTDLIQIHPLLNSTTQIKTKSASGISQSIPNLRESVIIDSTDYPKYVEDISKHFGGLQVTDFPLYVQGLEFSQNSNSNNGQSVVLTKPNSQPNGIQNNQTVSMQTVNNLNNVQYVRINNQSQQSAQ